jgi:hypothetical protein
MDPNPFKHPAVVLAKIRSAIEPSLSAAGFRFEGRNKPSTPVYLYLDYMREDDLFRLSWDRRDSDHFIGFTAELAPGSEGYKPIARSDLSYIAKMPKEKTTAEIQLQIDSFAKVIKAFLDRLVRPDC